MSTVETNIDSSKFNLWNPLINLATFSGAGYYLGYDVITKLGDLKIRWIPTTSLTPADFAIGGAFNALAVSGIEYISKADQPNIDFDKFLLVTLTLAAAVFIVPHLSQVTTHWTGVVLTSEKMITLAAFNGAIKAISTALLYFTQYLKKSSVPTIPTTVEEARKISQAKAVMLYDLFKKDTLDWEKLPLSLRTALNRRFAESGNDILLPFHGFKDNVGEDFKNEDITFLHQKTKESTAFSPEERKYLNTLFYENGLYEGAIVDAKTVPEKIQQDLAAYEITDYATLPEANIRWIHHYFATFPEKSLASEEAQQALCDRLYDLKLPAPSLRFAPSKAPTQPLDIANPTEDEKYAVSWFYSYFTKDLSAWEKLSLTDRIAWSQTFLKELNHLFPILPTQQEIQALTPNQIHFFHQQYNEYGEDSALLWAKLGTKVKEELMRSFGKLGLSLPSTTTQQSSFWLKHQVIINYLTLGLGLSATLATIAWMAPPLLATLSGTFGSVEPDEGSSLGQHELSFLQGQNRT